MLAGHLTTEHTIDLGHGPERVVEIRKVATEGQLDIVTEKRTWALWRNDNVDLAEAA